MIHVTPVPCLRDNYAYLIEGDEPGVCAVVDPSEGPPVLAALAARRLRPAALLATHHHHDHVDGIPPLLAAFPGVPVLALEPDASKIAGVTRVVTDGEQLRLAGLSIRILHIPGHTLGAIAYVVTPPDGSAPAVFTGDTLFTAGCGRLFEGTAASMHRSLNEVLGSLPDATLVYCGHEYTESNLRFAAHVEPGNDAITRRQASTADLRSRHEPTVPSTLADERATNPFLRVSSPTLRASLGATPDDTDTTLFGHLRAAKDSFRG